MEVILKKDVKGTGKEGDLVTVSPGFARNKLIPSGVAVEATEANKRALAREKANLAQKIAEEKMTAENLAKSLRAKTITVKTKVGENGKLFGSITSMDIANAINSQTGYEIDKKKIVLDKPIKEVGLTQVDIKLYPEVTAVVKIKIEGGK
ncbi:MAG: 50S ribosomal protein L9 [Clostridiales bacterium]|nr:50S ribosomal protein L9 [Clostridiales bacterium]